ncbi:Protein of unknown function [Halobacillus karajensis]|uniref:DUF2817 domain-containing protein n=1 Tax=Halobacillus karajensis TaxID=195088 RepID=A0A024P2K2_9BACI|nr:M14 family metallopeptidase [Halobacillus karajensis]CDQ19910.1 hypothetical protein BN982_02217 [Halobacillus karajensis]CDQ22370.1 hypothetical protein BN983_00578 [Halobacillus karajensis]CDQ28213.1 hypothetical protein BN981_02507 [Halobacillus karajensis]SEH70078.1 Protein of unknown function [Halobacillus karajensis]
MEAVNHYFKGAYEESRKEFRHLLSLIQSKWPGAKLYTKFIGEEEDNTIDVLYAEADESNRQVLFMTSGEHGIEGYAGAAVIRLFVEEWIEDMDPSETGICLVHAINPWGMRNFRRVTENNVDLNRNYFLNPSAIPRDINSMYEKECHIFLPERPVESIEKEKTSLYESLSKGMMKEGYKGIKQAKGMGQFQFERGVYFGGKEEEPSVTYMKSWQETLLNRFDRIVHMDWHTALGPSNEVTMVMSKENKKHEEELMEWYGLNNIQVFSPEKVKGDSTNYFYELKKEKFPSKHLTSALFEFGTFGTSRQAELREFITIILENQLYWEGTKNHESREWIRGEFMNMFYPQDRNWKESVLMEARKAIQSVLRAEGILPR